MIILGKINRKSVFLFFQIFSGIFQDLSLLIPWLCFWLVGSRSVPSVSWVLVKQPSQFPGDFCLGGCVYMQEFALAVKLISARSGTRVWYLDSVWQGTRHSVPEKEPVLCALKSNCIHQLIKEWSWYALKGGLSNSILLSQRALQYRAQDRKYI